MLHGHGRLYTSRKTRIFLSKLSDVEARFETFNYEVERQLPVGKNKKVIRLKRVKLHGRIIMKFIALRPEMYSYLTDDGYVDEKT